MAIYNCGCQADSKGNPQGAQFQDKQYGQGRRVHTAYGEGAAETQKKQRCTVCGKVR